MPSGSSSGRRRQAQIGCTFGMRNDDCSDAGTISSVSSIPRTPLGLYSVRPCPKPHLCPDCKNVPAAAHRAGILVFAFAVAFNFVGLEQRPYHSCVSRVLSQRQVSFPSAMPKSTVSVKPRLLKNVDLWPLTTRSNPANGGWRELLSLSPLRKIPVRQLVNGMIVVIEFVELASNPSTVSLSGV
jgi:hypothetical protein